MPQLDTSFLEQHGDFADIDTSSGPSGAAPGNVNDSVYLSRTPLGDCARASKHTNDMGFTDLSSLDDFQQSHDDPMGSVGLPAGDIEDL
jgi:hypothetical protein